MNFKKIASLVLAVCLLSLCSISVSAADTIDKRKTATAYIGDITVDGKAEDAWNYATVINADIVKENASAYFGKLDGKVAGVDYAALKVSILWDGTSVLYLLYQVTDPLLNATGANNWEWDSIEWFIDLDNFNTGDTALDSQIRIEYDGTDLSGGTYYTYSSALTSDGYLVEIAIDMSALSPDLKISDGEAIGIDFQCNDDHNGDGIRSVCLGWSDTIDKASASSEVYGQLVFKSENSIVETKAAETETSGPAIQTDDVISATVSPATSDPYILICIVAAGLSIAGAFGFSKKK